MYLFAFSRFAGIDKVIAVDSRFLPSGVGSGDLLRAGEEFFLVLGDQVAFSEQYSQGWTPTVSFDLISSSFFSERLMSLFHWMVEERYSTYKAVIGYFLPDMDVERLLQKQEPKKIKTTKKSQKIDEIAITNTANAINEINKIDKIQGQTLLVFPDMWSMLALSSDALRDDEQSLVLSSKDGYAKKIRDWRTIKHGACRIILATHAEVFQDFSLLSRIVLVDPHTWYYINTQDPRYKIADVLAQLASLWGIEVEKVESQGKVLFDVEKTGK